MFLLKDRINNWYKFKELLSTDNVKDLIQLSKFVDIIMKKFSSVI